MRLRESVPLEEGKLAGVNAACHEGVLGEPNLKKLPPKSTMLVV